MKERDHLETAVIAEMPREAVRELLELLETAPIEILSTDRDRITLPQVVDAFDNEFLLGELIYPHAEVVWNGKRAFGPETGDEPERSLAWACTKLALQDADNILKLRIMTLLAREQQHQACFSASHSPTRQVA